MHYYLDVLNCPLFLSSAACLCSFPLLIFSVGMVSARAALSTDEGMQQYQPFPAETVAAFNGGSAKIGISIERRDPTTPLILYQSHRFELVAVVTANEGARSSDLPSSLLVELEVVLPKFEANDIFEERFLSKSQTIVQLAQSQAEADRLATLACIENINWDASCLYSGSSNGLAFSGEEYYDGTTVILRALLSLEDESPSRESMNFGARGTISMSEELYSMSDRLQMIYIKSQYSDSRQLSELKAKKRLPATCEVKIIEPLEVSDGWPRF